MRRTYSAQVAATVDGMRAVAGLEFRHLRAFVAVAEEGSFTAAATRLQLTQPALSRTVAQMERIVGTVLIHRTRRLVRLTPAGNRFLPYSRRVLDVLDEGVRSARGEPSTLRVGFTWGSAAEHIAPIVRAFEEEHPHVHVELHRYDDTLAGLTDGRTHVGFLPGVQRREAPVSTLVLAEEPRVAALQAEHRLSARRTVRLSDLREETLVINVISGTTSLDLWESGQEPSRSVRVHNVDEWLEAIAAGRGVGLTPASTGRLYRHPQIRYRRIVDAPPVPLLLAWPRTAPHPLAIDFVAIVERRPR